MAGKVCRAAHVYPLKPRFTPFYSVDQLSISSQLYYRPNSAFVVASRYPWRVSALIWWLIPLIACSGALVYVWWSINSKRRQDTYKSIAEYETFRSAFAKGDSTVTEHPRPIRGVSARPRSDGEEVTEQAPARISKARKKRRGTNEEQAR